MKKYGLLILIKLITLSVYAQNMDIDILRKINLGRNRNLDPTFQTITNSATPISLGIPCIIYTIGYLKKDTSYKFKGILIGNSILISSLFSTSLKYTFRRTRPFITYPDIEKASTGGSPSFPSGHTSAAFSTATALSIAFPKWYVIAPAYIWAGSMGYSRMHLGVHYPSDVLAGAIIGAGSSFLSWKLHEKLCTVRKKVIGADL